ncbi:MAG: hypothetical protein ACOCW3_00935 [Spirochaetota bacterium]
MTGARENPAARVVVLVALLFASSGVPAQNVDLNQITADDEFRWGVTAMHDGRVNEAIASFNRSLSADSDSALTRYWLGRAYYYGGFEQAALDEWRWVAEREDRTAVLDRWIERVELSRGLTSERLGDEITPGRYVTMVDLAGRQGDLTIFRRPTMIRPRSDGYFYVVSFGTHRVVLLDPNGVRRRVIDGGIEGFDRPFDVLPLDDGSLLVSEFGADRIARVSADGFKVGTFGGAGTDEGGLLGPQFLAGDGAGHLYVSDYGNKRVAKYTTDGEYLFSFGRLESPAGIVVMAGRVYVADSGAGLIAVFDESGNRLGEIRTAQMARPEGLSVYGPGEILVSDGHRLYVIEVEREVVSVVAELNDDQRLLGSALDANRNLLVADFASDSVLVMAASEELYTGLNVEVDYVNALDHPRVYAAVNVTDRTGRPLLGLDETNFRITEDRFPTGEVRLVYAGYQTGEAAVGLIVDAAIDAPDSDEAVRSATLSVHDALGGDDQLWVIAADEQPVIEAEPGDGRLETEKAAAAAVARGEAGRLDLGVRLGTSQLLDESGRRALVVVSDGQERPQAFESYSLTETAEHLLNNHVTLWVVYTSRDAANDELDYLAEATGGSALYAFRPEGVGTIVRDIKAQPSGSYVLEYSSVHDSDFGRRYIPLEVEAYLLERSGRDEAGYFGPLEF